MTGYSYRYLTLVVDARGVAQVRLNRPKVNAFDPELIHEITECFHALDKDPSVNVVVLSGEGKVFSAGAELSWMKDMAAYSYEENVADAMNLARMLETMHQFSKPLIGKIHGAAIGGGVGLTAVCDYAIAAEGARFAFTEVKLGLRPSTISSYCIPKLGVQNAMALFQTGHDFFADEAKRYGLIDQVAAAGSLDDEAGKMAAYALSHGKEGLRQRSEEGRADRETVAAAAEQHEKIVALVVGVAERLNDSTPAGRARLMDFTARDIADARSSGEAKEKINAFLVRAAQQKAS